MMVEKTFVYLGNKDLLEIKKIGFLASRKIPISSVLPTLDWAVSIGKRTDIAVVSGFHSRLEKEVLRFLLQGKCGIIVVLARGMYRKLPKQYEEAMSENRLLIISNEKENMKRISEATAHKRNKYIADICDEIKFIGVDEHSSLYEIMQ